MNSRASDARRRSEEKEGVENGGLLFLLCFVRVPREMRQISRITGQRKRAAAKKKMKGEEWLSL